MSAFKQILMLYGTLVALMVQVTASPIAHIAQLDNVIPMQHAGSLFLPHNTEHGAKAANVVTSIYIAPATSTAGPTPTPVVYEQSTQGPSSSWATAHPTALILLFTFMPFATCIVFYPLLKCLAVRKAAHRAQKTAKLSEKMRPPESPALLYLNNPRLEPVPAHPEMVYVPPITRDGAHSIFGHFRSPSGSVFGVTDRWAMAEKGIVYGVVDSNKSSDSQTLLVRPI